MGSKGIADALVLLLASRQVLQNVASQQGTRVSNYVKTSSIPRALGDVWSSRQKPIPKPTATEEGLAVTVPVAKETLVPAPLKETSPVPVSFSAPPTDVIPHDRATVAPPITLPSTLKPTPLADPDLLSSELLRHSAVEEPAERRATSAQNEPALLRQSRVPATRVGRLWHYGSLAASVGMGTIGEAVKRATGLSQGSGTSLVLSSSNVERIVNKLSRMRGAALKLGQMLSIQDHTMIPSEFESILLRVQNSANYMPDSQLEKTLANELGKNWRDKFESFDLMPIAAASIGQVHKAVLKNGRTVAVKVQYPGVANSIDSDLDNLRTLILFSNFLPKGLYLDNTIRVARKELAWECDYLREAEGMRRFAELTRGSSGLSVPSVHFDLSTRQVLTTDFVNGLPIGSLSDLPQHTRNSIGERILRLCLQELFEFRYMQTDPNWSNFLYDAHTDTIHLLDFGAVREFDKSFTDKYMQVLRAAAVGDREGCAYWSQQLGFLTGLESQAMTNAHVNSILTLSEPFRQSSADLYDFAAQDVTDRVRAEIPLMLRERLTPPPEETYSLHRKLSGAFLLCTKLRAKIRCKEIFESCWQVHKQAGTKTTA
ncbi:ABC1 family-domain-containing protein [Gaertneriomyces semiglobifer]|nr:ABC1 family-domain-containing protein [Gaertneriomyces semiglobifer]